MTCTDCSIVLNKNNDNNATLETGFLRIGGTSFPPFIKWTDIGNGGIRIEGPLVVFITTIARFLNAKPVVANPVGMLYGSLQKDGKFNGVLGYIQRKEADIFAAPSAPDPERHANFDYHAPFSREEIRLLTIRPSAFIDPWGFIRAFQPEVWFCILGTLIGCSICSAFLHKFDAQLQSRNRAGSTRGVFEYIWFWFSRLFPQPEITPGRFWLRLCSLFFMLPTSLMLMSALEGDLKGSLVFKKEMDHVNSFEDILRFPAMRLITEKDSVLSAMFQRNRHPFIRKLARRVETRSGVFSGAQLDSLAEEIVQLKAVVATADLGAKSAVTVLARKSGRCPNIKFSDGTLTAVTTTIPMGLHLPKSTRERIQNAVLRVAESYVFQQAIRFGVDLAYRCAANSRSSDEPLEALGMSDVKGVLYLYSIGLTVSIFAFVVEVIYTSRKRTSAVRYPGRC